MSRIRPFLLAALVVVPLAVVASAAERPDRVERPGTTRPADPDADLLSGDPDARPECDDPDLPSIGSCEIDKEEYLRARSEHIARLRGFPHALPYDPRARALQELETKEDFAKGHASPDAVESTVSSWTAIGPAPIPNGQTSPSVAVSGRVTAIDIHPTNASIAYVGTAQGGSTGPPTAARPGRR